MVDYSEYPPSRDGVVSSPGKDRLWEWFGLSYASFLTLPRVLMHEMPDEWQWKITQLLEQYYEHFPHLPDYGTRVQITQDRKLVKHPSRMLNYRHPERDRISGFKQPPSPTTQQQDGGK